MIGQVKESEFWQQAKRGLDGVDVHLCRIENSAGTGISDVNACCSGVEVWIELKVPHGQRLYFRNTQKTWIIRRAGVGGKVFVLVRSGDGLFLFDAVSVVSAPQDHSKDDKSMSILQRDLPTPLYWCDKPFNWRTVKEHLFDHP